MLRPPVGCRLDFAVGTTFSLDLVSALLLPLSFAFCDWQKPDGELAADPLALLEALRRYGLEYAVLLPVRPDQAACQVSPSRHLLGAVDLRRSASGRAGRIPSQSVGSSLSGRGRQGSVPGALPQPKPHVRSVMGYCSRSRWCVGRSRARNCRQPPFGGSDRRTPGPRAAPSRWGSCRRRRDTGR